jgi:hypothetical protein
MEKPSLLAALGKLAIAGEQAGFSLEQMIELLDQGLTVETLLDLISWRLESLRKPTARACLFLGLDRVASGPWLA